MGTRDLAYLRDAGDDAEEPRHSEHQFASLVGVVEVERVGDGEVPV